MMGIGSYSCKVLDHFLRAFCLTCTRFSSNEDTLILPFIAHVDPCTLGDGEDMWGVLVASFGPVLLYDRI